MKSQKFILLLFIVQMVLCLSLSVFAAENDVSYTMEGSSSIVRAGDTFTVTVKISENKGFLTSIANITYDPELVTYVSNSLDDSAYDYVLVNNPKQGNVRVTVGDMFSAMASSNPTVYDQTGAIVVLTFRVADGYEGVIDLSLDIDSGDVMTPNKEFNYTVSGVKMSVVSIDYETHVHTEVVEEAVEPACTEAGLSEGKYCSVCNEVLAAQEEVPAIGHTEVVDEAVAPTCTETGLSEGKHCSVCNEVLVAQEEVPAIGHTEVVDEAVAPTCTETGLSEGKHCSVCNEVLVAQEAVSATDNHVDADGKWEIDVDNHFHTCGCGEIIDTAKHTGGSASCVEKAVCEICGTAYGTVDTTQHGETEVRDAIEATEESEGYTGDTYCKDCGEKLVDGEEIAQFPHTHAMVKTDKVDATHEAAGNIEYYICSKCGKLYKDETGTEELTTEDIMIAKGEHTYEDVSDEDKHWQECECGSKMGEEDHTYSEWVETINPTASENGSKERICSGCGYKQTEELPKLEVVPSTGDTVVVISALGALVAIAAVILAKKKGVRC